MKLFGHFMSVCFLKFFVNLRMAYNRLKTVILLNKTEFSCV